MKCGKCGAVLKDGQKFCEECGEPVEQKRPEEVKYTEYGYHAEPKEDETEGKEAQVITIPADQVPMNGDRPARVKSRSILAWLCDSEDPMIARTAKLIKYARIVNFVTIFLAVLPVLYPVGVIVCLVLEWMQRRSMKEMGIWKQEVSDLEGDRRTLMRVYQQNRFLLWGALFMALLAVLSVVLLLVVGVLVMIFE